MLLSFSKVSCQDLHKLTEVTGLASLVIRFFCMLHTVILIRPDHSDCDLILQTEVRMVFVDMAANKTLR